MGTTCRCEGVEATVVSGVPCIFFGRTIKEKKFKHLTSSMMETPQSCRSKWTQVPLENSGSARQTRGSRMTFLSNHSHSETLANSNSKGFSGFGSHEVWWSGSQPRADCTFRPCQIFFSQNSNTDGSMNGEIVYLIGTTYLGFLT